MLALLRREEPGTKLARRYGISEQTLYRWRDEFVSAGESALAGSGKLGAALKRRIEELERELSQRDTGDWRDHDCQSGAKKKHGRLGLSDEVREHVRQQVGENPRSRLTEVLRWLGIAPSSWYRPRVAAGEGKRPGPSPKPIAEEVRKVVVALAELNPWYGYKRIAVMCRRAGKKVRNRESYRVMREEGLLQKRRSSKAELYQAAKLYELLPQKANDLWQMDVTYIHIPGYGWYYAVTVIDYYQRRPLTWARFNHLLQVFPRPPQQSRPRHP